MTNLLSLFDIFFPWHFPGNDQFNTVSSFSDYISYLITSHSRESLFIDLQYVISTLKSSISISDTSRYNATNNNTRTPASNNTKA